MVKFDCWLYSFLFYEYHKIFGKIFDLERYFEGYLAPSVKYPNVQDVNVLFYKNADV